MSFTLKDVATQWAEQRSSAVPFPFPTWAQFEAEFCLWFIEENEQDQALAKLKSHLYFQGSRDIYWYTDNFEELAITASYLDTLVWVTKYCSGLDPQIKIAITMSETAPDLTDTTGGTYAPSSSTKCSAIPGPETLRPVFWLLCLSRVQRAYSLLWHSCMLRSCLPRLRHLCSWRSF
jgi:hypothetical protein